MACVVGVLLAHRADFRLNAVGNVIFRVAPAHAGGKKVAEDFALTGVGKSVIDLGKRRACRVLGFSGHLAVGDNTA